LFFKDKPIALKDKSKTNKFVLKLKLFASYIPPFDFIRFQCKNSTFNQQFCYNILAIFNAPMSEI